jgi:hypothetical protein
MLLDNGNQFPYFPLAHEVHVIETYENVQVLLQN